MRYQYFFKFYFIVCGRSFFEVEEQGLEDVEEEGDKWIVDCDQGY